MDKEIIVINIIMVIFIIFIVLIFSGLIYMGIKYTSYGEHIGIVVDKRYTKPYTTFNYSGKVFIPIYHREKYEILIEKKINNENKRIWLNITKEEYEKYNNGDFYGE